ncbi:MAG: ABC transporter permease subunit [Rhizobiales bacterium]|nr:ABC transporter permease subunit [Hyphomicrobiales bacterium]
MIAIVALAGFIAVGLRSPDSDFISASGLLLRGFWMTLIIWITSCTVGAFLAGFLVAGDLSRFRLLHMLARVEINFFRGTPLIAQLYLVYYGAGEISPLLEGMNLWWIFKSPLSCVIMVFVLNTAAYQAHVVAGAIRALPKEQNDGARALGLSVQTTMFKVLLPQAMIIAIRPLANEVTKMVKASAIASVVTVLDLLGVARMIFHETLDFSFLFIAACVYLILIGLVRIAMEMLEGHLLRHLSLAPTTSRARQEGTSAYLA